MSKVVVVSGHPNLESSFTNRVILDKLNAEFESIDVRRLDMLYPNYQINVEAEQQALLGADVVVTQFPFYWYSVPALMKKWIDDVMSFNFAYGPEGDKLKGKHFIVSTTVGGPAESYDPLGYNHFTIEQLLHPLQQTAHLAGMHYHKPIYTNSMVYIPGVYNTFHAMLRNDVSIHVPEGEFNGIAGFNDWYALLRTLFAPNCEHTLSEIDVVENGDVCDVQMKVRVQAESLQGEQIDMEVAELWQVAMVDGKARIVRYEVQA